MIQRDIIHHVEGLISRHPAVAVLGPRQIGKTTLAHQISEGRPSLYLDLELPSVLARLENPESYLSTHADKLVILDEIQRVPGLFQVLRGLIDQGRQRGQNTGRFLVLGSASLDLLHQSAESLAGRIAYVELGPLSVMEVENNQQTRDKLWMRGGFPNSFLSNDDASSLEWRQLFIRTYLERDIPQLGPRVPAETLRRFWTMLANEQGATLNAARLAGGLGVTGQTVGRYLDMMTDLLLVRQLRPWISNVGKRLVKSPKIYLRDSGIAHALLNIHNFDMLLGHPIVGPSWEGFVIENLLEVVPFGTEAGFYRTGGGAEIDLVLSFGQDLLWVIEIKRSFTPNPERGFYEGCLDLKPQAQFIVYPGSGRYTLSSGVEVIGLIELMQEIKKVFTATLP
jgi:predicted AAA+ superfamily ATPase